MIVKRALALALCGSVSLAACAPAYATTSPYQAAATMSQPAPSASATQETSNQVQQLVAPIALYPDSLVAQILAASTYPAEVVEAQRWIAQHHSLHGKQLADQVNTQSWDPSVKALMAFPSVLANMNSNLSWTSALGEAYVKDPQDVMNTVQDLRQRAEQAGNLRSTPQQTVSTQGQQIVIEPSDPDVVYVPQYDPWLAYGPPLVAWPSWYWYPGLYLESPGIAFGLGIGIGLFAGFGWGWHHWGFDWGRHAMLFNHRAFVSRNARIFNHRVAVNHQFRGGFHHFGGAAHFGGSHFAGGYHHFGGVQHFASAAHFGGFHGGGFHGGGFHGGGHGGRR
jgi:Protein of unknown function (DUF3300)